MSEKQSIEAGNSLPHPLGSACECQNWADLDLRVRLLTGHHARCPRGGNPLEAAFKLLKELTRGIECWAHEEDGEVFMDCWKPYREAKALEGVCIPEEPEQAWPNAAPHTGADPAPSVDGVRANAKRTMDSHNAWKRMKPQPPDGTEKVQRIGSTDSFDCLGFGADATNYVMLAVVHRPIGSTVRPVCKDGVWYWSNMKGGG